VCVCTHLQTKQAHQTATSTSDTLPNDKHKYPLTPISRDHLKKMKVTQVAKTTPGLHESRKFLTSS